MMRTVYSDDYMGRRFDLKAYNCWHLVRDIWRDMTTVDLGDLTPPDTRVEALHDAAWEASEGPAFERLARAQEPCIVLMRKRGACPHVGVLLRWRVLHMRPTGVVYQWMSDVELEFDSVEYYVPAGFAA